jgi:hypothetical protein
MSSYEKPSWSVRPMMRRKLELLRFCARVDRRCARMNNGLAAVAIVLAITTISLSALRAAEAIVSDQELEMSTDGGDTGMWWIIGE